MPKHRGSRERKVLLSTLHSFVFSFQSVNRSSDCLAVGVYLWEELLGSCLEVMLKIVIDFDLMLIPFDVVLKL